MSAEVLFPEVSKKDPNIEGVVATWFVGDGDHVTEGQLIAEVQVEKVDAEVYAPDSGVIKILSNEQLPTRQSSVIAVIEN